MGRWILICLMAWVIGGCGGMQATTDILQSANPTVRVEAVTGRIFLGVPVASAQIVLQDLEGQELARAVSDRSGAFLLRGAFPPAFRVLARVGSLEFASQVNDFSGQTRSLTINVPTTLVSRLAQAQPGQSLTAVEAEVRRRLGLPVSVSLSHGIEESAASPFSHVAFFVAAGSHGGYEDYSRQIVSGPLANPAPTQPVHRLTLGDLSAPLNALEPSLAQLVEKARSQRSLQLSVSSALLEPTGRRLPALSPKEGESAGIAGSLLDYVGEGVGASLLDASIDTLYTWVAEQLGWNFGTTTKLDSIQDTLFEVQAGVEAIQISLDRQDYQSGADALKSYVDSVSTQTSKLISTMQGFQPTNQPFSPSNAITTLVSSLGSADFNLSLKMLQDYMLGTAGGTNMIELARSILLTDNLGIQSDSAPAVMNFPLRSQGLLDEVLQTYNYYGGYQVLACNLLAESAHIGTDLPGNIAGAQSTLAQAAISLKKQRQQLPEYPPSNQVLIDLQFGMMWLLSVQDEQTFEDAQKLADDTVIQSGEVTYDDWRLPTFSECKALQTRGRFASSSQRGDYGASVEGLAGLGFLGTDLINQDGDIWMLDFSVVTPQSSNWSVGLNNEFRLNHQTANYGAKSGFATRPFILCRAIGQPLLPPDGPSTPVSGSGFPATLIPNPLTAAEAPYLGVCRAVAQVTHSTAQLQLGAQLRYEINLGGSFRCGTSSDFDTFSVPFSSSSFTLDRSTLPLYTTDNRAVEISNYPATVGRQLWHADSSTGLTVKYSAHVLGLSDQGLFPTELVTSVTFSQNPPVRQLRLIQIAPRNQIYNLAGSGSISTTATFKAARFLTDGSVFDVTSQVKWEVVDTNGNAVTGASFSSQTPGLLVLDKGLGFSTPNLVVRATLVGASALQSNVDQTSIQVDL